MAPPPNSITAGWVGPDAKVTLGTTPSQKEWESPELMMGVLPRESMAVMKLRSVLKPSCKRAAGERATDEHADGSGRTQLSLPKVPPVRALSATGASAELR